MFLFIYSFYNIDDARVDNQFCIYILRYLIYFMLGRGLTSGQKVYYLCISKMANLDPTFETFRPIIASNCVYPARYGNIRDPVMWAPSSFKFVRQTCFHKAYCVLALTQIQRETLPRVKSSTRIVLVSQMCIKSFIGNTLNISTWCSNFRVYVCVHACMRVCICVCVCVHMLNAFVVPSAHVRWTLKVGWTPGLGCGH